LPNGLKLQFRNRDPGYFLVTAARSAGQSQGIAVKCQSSLGPPVNGIRTYSCCVVTYATKLRRKRIQESAASWFLFTFPASTMAVLGLPAVLDRKPLQRRLQYPMGSVLVCAGALCPRAPDANDDARGQGNRVFWFGRVLPIHWLASLRCC